jgi:DNA-binding IclR family transcriptional regulator
MPARNHIDLVVKVMKVLEALQPSESGVSLKDVTAKVGLVKSSVFRILYTLRESGYVEQTGEGSYRLTLKMCGLVRRPAVRPTLINIARPHLLGLRDRLQESVWLAERRRTAVIIVDVAEAGHRLRLSFDIGDRCPVHATALGKAIAAHLPAQELDTLLHDAKLRRFTGHTLTRRADVAVELAKVRRRGYSINNEETVVGALLVGAPIFDSVGAVFAAVSLSAPMARCSSEKKRAMIAGIRQTSQAITRDLDLAAFRVQQNGSAEPGPDARDMLSRQ